MSNRERGYEVVPGFFVQDDPEQEDVGKMFPRFGLIDDSPNRWTTFARKIKELDETAASGVQYKVFLLARHGEGYHNLGEEIYGSDDRRWVKLDGDGSMVWADARLTDLGERQARDVRAVWKEERRYGIPVPETFYTSPLTRAIQTHQLTFDESVFPALKVTILKGLRDVHARKYTEFPECLFEDGFPEEGPCWTLEFIEAREDVLKRCRKVLDMIFDKDDTHVTSITSHGGFLGALLDFIGHRTWNLPMGGVIPVVIKGTSLGEDRI